MLLNKRAPEQQVHLESGSSTATDERVLALESARKEDQAWREERQIKTEDRLKIARFASSAVFSGLNLVARGLGVMALANALVIAGYGITGNDAVPDAILMMLAIGLGGLAIVGALAALCRLMRWGVVTGVRSWASHQEIELAPETENPKGGAGE